MNTRHMYALTHRLVAVAIVAAVAATSSAAQQVLSPGNPLPPYRPPALALVQPAAGGNVPQDRPVVVFRFAPGEPNDQIDVRSFVMTVDGVDGTALFQIAAAEAWGPLANVSDSAAGLGAHQLTARICSVRGACADLSTTVSVIKAAPAGVASQEAPAAVRRRKVVDALVSAVRRLLEP